MLQRNSWGIEKSAELNDNHSKIKTVIRKR